MAIYAAARRTSDGLLTGLQGSPNTPDEATMIQKGESLDSGATWEMILLTQEQYGEIIAALPGRSYLNDDTITSATPPQLSSEVTGAGEVTVTCDVGDAGFTGAISWACIPPDGVPQQDSGNAVAGVDTWVIQTGQIGNYTVRVDTETFGAAEIQFKEA